MFESLFGMSRMDRVRNNEMLMRDGTERKLAKRVNQRALRRFGHVKRMDDYRTSKRVVMADGSGGRVPGRPRLGWMDGVKMTLGSRWMTVEAARQCAKDRKK